MSTSVTTYMLKRLYCGIGGLLGLLFLAASPVFAQTGTIQGTVTDQEGIPLSGVQVTVVGTQIGALTNSDGFYQLSGVPTGTQTVRASVLGYQTSEKTVDVVAGETVTLDFSLQPPLSTGVIEGTVFDQNKQPIAGATVTVVGENLRTTTNSDGFYQLSDVPADTQTVRAGATGYQASEKIVNVPASDTTTANFALSPTPQITVTVPNGGETWTMGTTEQIEWTSQSLTGGVRIDLVSGSPSTFFSIERVIASRTLNDGTFTWAIPTDLEPFSNYRIVVSSVDDSSIRDYSDGGFTIQAPTQPTTGTITGRVFDAGTRDPLAGAEVVLEGTERGTTTDNQGRYLLSSIPEGAYIARASSVGYEAAEQEVSVVAGDTITVDFSLRQVGPDLVVSALTHAPESPTTADIITFTAVVTNNGTATAGTSTLEFKVDGESSPPTFAVPSLAPGERFTVERKEQLPVAQNYQNTATADVANEVAESNENNNVTTDTYSVSESTVPEIVVTVPNGGETWTMGTTEQIEWTSQNLAGDVRVDLLLDGNVERAIISSTPDEGVFDWSIPTTLPASSAYQIRISSVDEPSVSDLSDSPFTIETAVQVPTAVTNPATNVTGDGATLNGTVNPGGGETTVMFEYGLTTDYSNTVSAEQSPLSGTSDQAVSATITSLQPGSTYHVRVVASNGAGTATGDDQTFTTTTPILEVSPSTLDFGTVTVGDTARKSVTIENPGTATLEVRTASISGAGASAFAMMTSLPLTIEPEQTASVSLRFAPSSGGTAEATLDFDSNVGSAAVSVRGQGEAGAPEAITGTATEVTSSGAKLAGTVNPRGAETTVVFEYEPVGGGATQTVLAEQSPVTGAETQSVSAAIAGLAPGTEYAFRVMASSSAGSATGERAAFMTRVAMPAAVTGAASNVTGGGATLNGTVNPGGSETTVTFEYGLTTDYGDTITAEESPLSGTGEQAVSAAIAGLVPGTTYHFRVVAQNAAGAATGDDQTFTTEAPVLSVRPSELAFGTVNVGEVSASKGVVIENEGSAPLTIASVTFRNGTDFRKESDTGEATLAPGATRTLDVAFAPQSRGPKSDELVIESENGGSKSVSLTGAGSAPAMAVEPTTLNFGRVAVGSTAQEMVTIRNPGNAILVVRSLSIEGPAAPDFAAELSLPLELEPEEAVSISIAFTPTGSGAAEASLGIESNAGQAAVGLSGNGIAVEIALAASVVSTGEPTEVSAVTSPDFRPTEQALYYRRGGERSYEQVELVSESETSFRGAIPAAAVTERGVDFYVVLTDGALTVTFPAERPTEEPVHLRTRSATLAAAGPFAPETYRMISVPVVPEDGRLEAVLSEYGAYDPQRWRLLRWDPQAGTSGAYRELEANRDFAALDASFAPGVAFWLITQEGMGFSVEDGQSVDGSGPFSITLQPGWNQVANPFAFPVSWSQVEMPSGVDAPRDALSPHDVISVLEPWQGYWVFNRNTSPVQISVPPVEAGEATGAVAARKQSKASTSPFTEPPAYTLQLIARLDQAGKRELPIQSLHDRQNYVGWAEDATAHFGAEDIPEVPPVGSHVRLSVIEGGTRLAGSLRPSGTDGQVWNLEVTAEVDEPFFRRKTVTVQLHDRGTRPSGYQLQIIDDDNGQTMPIRNNQFPVALTSDQPIRHLRLVMGTPGFTEGETSAVTPRVTTIGPGYPTPSPGAVSVDYQLEERRRVQIAVYDVLGRRVRTLIDRRQPAGNYTARWDGRRANGALAASGVYMVRMQAGSFAGTRRIVLVR